MKKALLSLAALLVALPMWAQFSENFNNITTGSNGVGNLPAGWTQYNKDGRTPVNTFMGTNAWVVGLINSAIGKVALSVSNYSPAGQSDDWMITPKITVPNSDDAVLKFTAMRWTANLQDQFQVRISTTNNIDTSFKTTIINNTIAPNQFALYWADLSAYKGQDVYIAFINNSNNQQWLFIDDIAVVEAPFDVELADVSFPRFGLKDDSYSIVGTLKNYSKQTINKIVLEWSDGTNTHEETLTGYSIPPFGSMQITHPVSLQQSTVGQFNINVNVKMVNDSVEANMANNAKIKPYNTVTESGHKKVLFEEGTGTWCGWCPRGFVAMEYMEESYEDFVGIAVHNGDPMVVAEHDSRSSFPGYPTINVDRALLGQSLTSQLLESYYNQRINEIAPGDLKVTNAYNNTTRQLQTTVSFKFNTSFTSAPGLRFAAIVVEDSVRGTTSQYNQRNYYSNSTNVLVGYGKDWQKEPDPVPASKMFYNHTGRALLGGFDGQANSLPGTINLGEEVSFTFNYTVPASYKVENIRIAGLLIDEVTGEVYNTGKAWVLSTGINEELVKIEDIKLFPNPAADQVTLNFNSKVVGNGRVEIIDQQGKLMMAKGVSLSQGANATELEVSTLAAGNYLVSVSTNGSSSIQNLQIVK